MKIGLRLTVSIILLALALSAVSAQEAMPSRHVLELQFSAAPTEPPSVEVAGDTGIFKINPVGTVTGDLEGTLSQRITFVDPEVLSPAHPVNYLEDGTTFFTIETSDGTIEGYYYGAFSYAEDTYPDAIVRQQGLVLSVTAAYADLYLADVYYDGVVDFEDINGALRGIGDSGTLIIAPR